MPVPLHPPALQLAARTARIEPFRVMELVKRARALEHAGRSITHLSIGEPDFTAAPPVVAALKAAVDAGATGYTAALGLHALREAIARHAGDAHGVDLDPARVVVTAGASAALLLACCALVDPGAQVLMADPCYPCNRHFVSAFDGVPVTIPVGAGSRFQLDAATVAAHWTAAVRGVLLATPSNPTGTSIAFDELARLVDVARARGGFTLVDEIYLDLAYGHRPQSAVALGSDVLVAGSFSKFFHMTGWRLGWLVVPPALVDTFEKLAQNLFICPSALAQHAALACFEPEAMALYRQRRDEFQARRDYIVPALRELGFSIPVEPDGAFYVYLDCSAFTADSSAFASQMLEEAGVALVPGEDFGSHQPQRWLRLSYATSLAHLHEAVQRLRAWLPPRTASPG
ncbi:MAG: pyridoxal phosphate-dependent aminotransferase [Rubrivivax sp.]|nr:pyridoxal phosphate-dependent aminotransferase [Rubrivivax sp.]